MVLCARRSTRCGVVFLLSHGFVTSREQIVVEQIVADLVPQILDGVQHVPRERVQYRVVEQVVGCARVVVHGRNRGAFCW